VRGRTQLLRFVIGPDGEIVPDVAARLPGRGLWLTPRRDIVERAVAKRVFARAARRPVAASPDLPDRVEALLAARCGDAVGLARRAGLAVAGAERVGEALRAGKAAMLLFALEGAAGGRRKMAGLGRGLPAVIALTGAELGLAFARDRVIHAVVGAGPLCGRILGDARRLAGFRAGAEVVERMEFTPTEPAQQDGGTVSI